MTDKRLTRTTDDHKRRFFGVAAGIANYFNVDVTVVRLLFTILAIADPRVAIIYLALAVIMPVVSSIDEITIVKEKTPEMVGQ